MHRSALVPGPGTYGMGCKQNQLWQLLWKFLIAGGPTVFCCYRWNSTTRRIAGGVGACGVGGEHLESRPRRPGLYASRSEFHPSSYTTVWGAPDCITRGMKFTP